MCVNPDRWNAARPSRLILGVMRLALEKTRGQELLSPVVGSAQCRDSEQSRYRLINIRQTIPGACGATATAVPAGTVGADIPAVQGLERLDRLRPWAARVKAWPSARPTCSSRVASRISA